VSVAFAVFSVKPPPKTKSAVASLLTAQSNRAESVRVSCAHRAVWPAEQRPVPESVGPSPLIARQPPVCASAPALEPPAMRLRWITTDAAG